MDYSDYQEMNRLSQEELLSEALAGNGEAFSAFCVRVLPGLIRYLELQCRKTGVPVDLAQDFAHETLVRAINYIKRCNLTNCDPPQKLSPTWLSQIGYHLVIDWLRSNQLHQKAEFVLQQSKISKPTRQEQDQHEEVLKFSRWLPGNEQEMVELVLLKSMHVLDAGKEMGLSDAAAYKTYERALKHLRDLIQEHGSLAEQLSRR